MRLKIVATTAILSAIGLAASTNATTSAQVAKQLEDKQCQNCNLLRADANDVQQRREQRQQRREQRQEQLQQLPPEVRQQLQEQQQQRQEVRQERREQRQEQLQQLPPEVRQQLQERRQEVRQEIRQERQEQWQQLPPDIRQQRIEQWQQIPPNVRQERRDDRQDARQERRDDRRDARQERRDDRQDARQERRDFWQQDAWLHQNDWHYAPGSTIYVAPAQTYVTPAPGVNSIKVEMMSLTKDQATVVIENADARQELSFTRNRTRQTVYLTPGIHKLWFKNAKGSSWISGTLNLGKSDRIRISFNEDKELVQVYDDPQAWAEDRRFSRQTQVR
jgi:hypothetical protein